MREQIVRDAQDARDAARVVATLSTARKNAVLRGIADELEANHSAILKANARDMSAARATPGCRALSSGGSS